MLSATPERLKFDFHLVQFQPQHVALARQPVTFGEQRFRHDDVARAGGADERRGRILRRAIWTGRAQGATLSTKLVVPTRPSVSLISTRTMCSPAGSETSGMSIPVGWTKDLTRGVRSTFGVLR